MTLTNSGFRFNLHFSKAMDVTSASGWLGAVALLEACADAGEITTWRHDMRSCGMPCYRFLSMQLFTAATW